MKRVAGIDIGTNSTRLLVLDVEVGHADKVFFETHVTRLGEGVDSTGRLSEAAVERTLDVVRSYVRTLRELRTEFVRVTATSAARDAENSGLLTSPLLDLGLRVEVVDGLTEAGLTLAGVRSGGLSAGLVVDPGGGSTEVIFAPEGGNVAAETYDVGCVRVTERFIESDPVSEAEREAAVEYVTRTVRPFREAHGPLPPEAVFVAGTATALAAIHLGLDVYEADVVHRSVIRRTDVEKLLQELAGMSLEERRAIPSMEPGRAEVIVGGAATVLGCMRALELERLVISEHDILWGLALSADQRLSFPD